MPVAPSPTQPVPYYWSFYGHSYYQGSFGTHGPAGRADSQMRSLFGLSQLASTKNHAMIGARLTNSGLAAAGYARVLQYEKGNPLTQGFPDVAYDGAFFLGWGINDLGFNGNTAQNNTAYQHALRMAISRVRCARQFDSNTTTGTGAFTYGAGFTVANFQWEVSAGNTFFEATATTNATISWTIPADYAGGAIVFLFLAQPGVKGATWTWGGTAGVTGTTSTSNILPLVSPTVRCPVVRRITNLTSANAGQTITLSVTAIDAGGTADFGGMWIESPWPPPVLVANTPRLNLLGYSAYAKTYASSLTGTAVSSTPATITLASGTPFGTSTGGILTCPSAGGTVTITYTGQTLTAFTGCTTSGGSGNYTSSTLSYAGPVDADVATFNASLTALLPEFDGMVQVVDLDTAISKNALALGTDGLHPSELGASLIAAAFWSANQRFQPGSVFGPGSQLNVPNRSLVPLVVPHLGGFWHTSAGVTVGGTAYTAVAQDMFFIPFHCTSQGEWWNAWSVETLAGTGAATIQFAIYDDRNTNGSPKHLYINPCSGPITLATGAAVFTSPGTGNGFLTVQPDPGLYWLALWIVTAGTGVTFRTNKGPALHMPQLTTGGGGATTQCGWKTTGNASLPTSIGFPFNPQLNSMSDNCPMIGINMIGT